MISALNHQQQSNGNNKYEAIKVFSFFMCPVVHSVLWSAKALYPIQSERRGDHEHYCQEIKNENAGFEAFESACVKRT